MTIYSSEEKIGKTMLAINLGVSLIQETQKSAVLLDLSASDQDRAAWSLLKFPMPSLLQQAEVTPELVKSHVLRHSSKLSLLSVNASMLAGHNSAGIFARVLFDILQELFDYILVDVSSRLNALTYEVIDLSDTFIVMSSSLDSEYPIGILGHHNFRRVVNLREESSLQSTRQHFPDRYFLPHDIVTLDMFRRNGIPFVIQSPHRMISQVIGKLARDIGERQFGVAFTGGAALALTQLGILEVFDRNRIAIDMVAGVSFGALLGSAYAAGIELPRIKRHVVDWAVSHRLLSWLDLRILKRNMFQESRLQTLCDTLLKNIYFEELPMPVNVVAVDIRRGKCVVFREGKVLDAIKSSMRIPGLFVPFKHTEQHLIDGSMMYPTPIFPLKQLGAHFTIGVTVMPSPRESHNGAHQKAKGQLTPEQQAAKQNYSLVAATFDSLMDRLSDDTDYTQNIERLAPDVSIIPNVKGISWRDFHKVNELIECGIRAAEEALPKIESLKWGKEA